MRDEITARRLKEVLDYHCEWGIFIQKKQTSRRVKVGSVVGYKRPSGYVAIMIDGKNYYAHRLAWLYMTGKWPDDQVDHIDGNRSNNRISNIRECNRHQNAQNCKTRSDNKLGIKGVSFSKKDNIFVTQIQSNGKVYQVGSFKTAEEAQKAYAEAALKYHGEFARIA